MRILRGRNVNDLFYEGMHLLDEAGVREQSRAGDVMVAPWPVMSVYERPMERVLFDAHRDANPFFHLMEGLWMIAGRNDSSFLNRYISDFGQRFAEPDGDVHDAYGHRWREAMGFDQLSEIVRRLRDNPQDRQCVLQMWDARTDNFENGMNDLRGDWRGRPCNTHAYFRVRDVAYRDPPVTDQNSAEWESRITRGEDKVLDMTICCRSNDAVWGAHGANAVHFSMLMEYVAGRVGVQVGTMYQLSNNYHSYIEVLSKIGDPVDLTDHDPYECGEVHEMPMAYDWDKFDDDLRHFMRWHDDYLWGQDEVTEPYYELDRGLANDWFLGTAGRVALARRLWTRGMRREALATAEAITSPDWRRACVEWMERRTK